MAMTATGSAPDLSNVASGTAPLDQELAALPSTVITERYLDRFNAETDAPVIGDNVAVTPDLSRLVGLR